MTATVETIISCDGENCNQKGSYDMDHCKVYPASQQRRQFLFGWRFIKGKDYCPDCVLKLPFSSQNCLKTPRRKPGSLTKSQLRKVGTLIAAAHVIQQDVYGEVSEEVCFAAREAGLSLLRRYKCEDMGHKLLVCEDIEAMVRSGEL